MSVGPGEKSLLLGRGLIGFAILAETPRRRTRSFSKAATAVALSLYLTACGGGANETGAPANIDDAPAPMPTLSFTAAETSVVSGAFTTLSWRATNADSCSAGDGWSGVRATSGDELVGPIDMNITFALSCTGNSGSVERDVSIAVESVSVPSLNLAASSSTVLPGGTVTLTWTGESVSNCLASDAWSGMREPNGSETVGPIDVDSTYALTCDTLTGAITSRTTVLVFAGGTTISWLRPSENVDGSALQDLVSFGIYIGIGSGLYDQYAEVLDPHATSAFVPLAPGEYYIVMTAVDVDGNESAYSNEIVRLVR